MIKLGGIVNTAEDWDSIQKERDDLEDWSDRKCTKNKQDKMQGYALRTNNVNFCCKLGAHQSLEITDGGARSGCTSQSQGNYDISIWCNCEEVFLKQGSINAMYEVQMKPNCLCTAQITYVRERWKLKLKKVTKMIREWRASFARTDEKIIAYLAWG